MGGGSVTLFLFYTLDWLGWFGKRKPPLSCAPRADLWSWGSGGSGGSKEQKHDQSVLTVSQTNQASVPAPLLFKPRLFALRERTVSRLKFVCF